MWTGSRGSTLAAWDGKTFPESTGERVRRRTSAVGASSGEGVPDSVRGLLPPLMRDDVMDLNHEL